MKVKQRKLKSVMKSEHVPPEIFFDVFSLLPVKSLVRFTCASKLCASIITSQSFSEAHTARYSAFKPLPSLLLTCPTKLQRDQLFFSADLQGGSALHLMTIPPRFSRYTTPSVNGIVCLDFGLSATIVNPSTRRFLALPLICPPDSPEASGSTFFCVNSFGFDPVSKLYKVLNSWVSTQKPAQYRVFTLGETTATTTMNSWRLLDGGPNYYPKRESVCIDGTIYFRGCLWCSQKSTAILVAFHLETESFSEISLPLPVSGLSNTTDLVQLGGRLAIVAKREDPVDQVNEMKFFVLEDPHKGMWVEQVIVFPFSWKEFGNYRVVGTIWTGEILLAPRTLSKQQVYVYYYQAEGRPSMRRVELSGIPEYDSIDCFSNDLSVTFFEENILFLG